MKTNRIEKIENNKSKMENATIISDATRRWLVALGMVQDVREYCIHSQTESKNEGYPIYDRDKELLEAVKGLQLVINKYLIDQINMSILGIGDACDGKRI